MGQGCMAQRRRALARAASRRLERICVSGRGRTIGTRHGLEERGQQDAHDARQERDPLLGGERREALEDAVRRPKTSCSSAVSLTGPASAWIR